MRSYTVKKIQGKPQWNEIPELQIDNLLWTDSIDVSAKAQLCWNEEALYVRMEAVEPNIRMEETSLTCDVCFDSCLEFFFRPTDRPDYMNIELNPNKAIWLGYGAGIKDLIRLLVPNVTKLFDIQVEFTEGGWAISYCVPVSFLHRFFPEFEAKEGAVLHANLYKCGDKTVKPHYLSWNPIELEDPAFHCPEYFGELVLGGE